MKKILTKSRINQIAVYAVLLFIIIFKIPSIFNGAFNDTSMIPEIKPAEVVDFPNVSSSGITVSDGKFDFKYYSYDTNKIKVTDNGQDYLLQDGDKSRKLIPGVSILDLPKDSQSVISEFDSKLNSQ